MSYSSLIPLMKKKGSPLSPEKFHERVNVVFHDHEAATYDKMHQDMKNSLQEQVDLLINDLITHPQFEVKKSRLLDVGCGTGLSSEFLIKSNLGTNIEHITLLDTSRNMLLYAEEKAKTWNRDYEVVNSTVFQIVEKFDIVIICSVLHHIPDLNSFLYRIKDILKKNGILIHLQDPNKDYLKSISYKERLNSFDQIRRQETAKKKWIKFIPKSFRSKINQFLGRKNYIDLINDQLIREGVIKKRMTADELWSVTDIHVPSTPDGFEKGISFKELREVLKDFTLINQRSYGFFGKLKFDLEGEFFDKENELIRANNLEGRNLSGVWIKNN